MRAMRKLRTAAMALQALSRDDGWEFRAFGAFGMLERVCRWRSVRTRACTGAGVYGQERRTTGVGLPRVELISTLTIQPSRRRSNFINFMFVFVAGWTFDSAVPGSGPCEPTSRKLNVELVSLGTLYGPPTYIQSTIRSQQFHPQFTVNYYKRV